MRHAYKYRGMTLIQIASGALADGDYLKSLTLNELLPVMHTRVCMNVQKLYGNYMVQRVQY